MAISDDWGQTLVIFRGTEDTDSLVPCPEERHVRISDSSDFVSKRPLIGGN
jgi:hypothetical protein